MATIVFPGTDRLTVEAADDRQALRRARSRSARRGGAQRKGVVEKAIAVPDAVVVAHRAGVLAGARRRPIWIAGASRSPTAAAAADEHGR